MAMASEKTAFDIDAAMARIEDAVRPYPKAALFELAEEGYASPFEQLVACIISIRTRDEVTLPTARRLFERARTPAAVSRLGWEEIDGLIGACLAEEGLTAALRGRRVESARAHAPAIRGRVRL